MQDPAPSVFQQTTATSSQVKIMSMLLLFVVEQGAYVVEEVILRYAWSAELSERERERCSVRGSLVRREGQECYFRLWRVGCVRGITSLKLRSKGLVAPSGEGGLNKPGVADIGGEKKRPAGRWSSWFPRSRRALRWRGDGWGWGGR
jgi:hypothetical protein